MNIKYDKQLFRICVFVIHLVDSVTSSSQWKKCTGHPDELVCFGPTDEYCYLYSQRCDGIEDCPHADLADECLCDKYCETKPHHRYCPETNQCIEWGTSCPRGEVAIPEDACPEDTPYQCWRISQQRTLTKEQRTCYSDQERCDGVVNCLKGEDEENCPILNPERIFSIFVIMSIAVFVTICTCLFCWWWRRKSRLRLQQNIQRHAASTGYGQPPPYSISDEANQDYLIGLPPPIYIGGQPPSYAGPSSVLPSYTEATSDNEENTTSHLRNKSKISPTLSRIKEQRRSSRSVSISSRNSDKESDRQASNQAS